MVLNLKNNKMKLLYLILLIFISSAFFSCENNKGNTAKNIETTVKSLSGQEIYTKHCLACHQEKGEGVDGSFPSLKGKECSIAIILNGSKGLVMPSFKKELSDKEIAKLATYINKSFGNNYKEIKEEDVSKIRK